MLTAIATLIGMAIAGYAVCECVSQVRGLVREMRKEV